MLFVGFVMSSEIGNCFLGRWGFTPIPVFIGNRQLLLPLIYRGHKYPFKFHLSPIPNTHFNPSTYLPMQIHFLSETGLLGLPNTPKYNLAEEIREIMRGTNYIISA